MSQDGSFPLKSVVHGTIMAGIEENDEIIRFGDVRKLVPPPLSDGGHVKAKEKRQVSRGVSQLGLDVSHNSGEIFRRTDKSVNHVHHVITHQVDHQLGQDHGEDLS